MTTMEFKEIEPMIKSLAGKYANGDDFLFEELYQEGSLAACEAYKKYDPNKDTSFSTHAYNYIKGFLLNKLNRERNASVYGNEQEQVHLDAVLDRDPFGEPITALDQVSMEGYNALQDSIRNSDYIDDLIEEADLTEHEELCLRMYYIEELRQQVIATELGITQQAVAKTVNKALNKLQGK